MLNSAPNQFVVFVIAGGVAAVVNFCARFVLNYWIDFSVAVVLAYLSGMATAFILNRVFVFSASSVPIRDSAIRFALINALAVAQTWGISMVLLYYVLPAIGVLAFAPEIAHAIGIALPVFTSYLGHKYWSFRSSSSEPPVSGR